MEKPSQSTTAFLILLTFVNCLTFAVSMSFISFVQPSASTCAEMISERNATIEIQNEIISAQDTLINSQERSIRVRDKMIKTQDDLIKNLQKLERIEAGQIP